MIFKHLRMRNIRSYENLELEFPHGSVLLSGDIGAGKTSILLGLQFALFGLQPGQKGNSIMRHGADDSSISLEIEVDNKKIMIERTLKRGKSISQESNKITIDGITEELSTSEMKNRIIGLLEYPKEFVKKSNLLYSFTVYTPQEEMKSIIQERPEIRLDTLRHIFGVDRYKHITENSQIFLQKIKEAIKIKEIQSLEINNLKEKQLNENEEKIKLSKEINNLNTDLLKIQQEHKDAEDQLLKFQQIIQEKQKLNLEFADRQAKFRGKQELLTRLEKEISTMQNQIKERIDFSEENLSQILSLVGQHNMELDKLNLRSMDLNSKISVLESKKDNAFQLKDKVISLDNCPTCFQSVSPDHKEKITKRSQYDIDDVNRELAIKIPERRDIMKDIEKEKELVRNYEKDKQKLQEDKIKFQHQRVIEIKIKSDSISLNNATQEIKDLELQISDIKLKLSKFSDSESLFEKAKKMFDNIHAQYHAIEINLAKKNKELEILKKHLEEIENEILKKEKIIREITYLRSLQDWLEEKFLSMISSVERGVMARLRSEFSKIFNEWFSILVSESLSARLDEDFTPIISQQDYELEYDFLSGGERTAVALAYRLALNQVLNSLLSKIKTKGIIILDEPTDGFSEEQLEKMRDIFSQLNSEQIILVSHEPKIESFVDNIIRIKKEGSSMIEKKNA